MITLLGILLLAINGCGNWNMATITGGQGWTAKNSIEYSAGHFNTNQLEDIEGPSIWLGYPETGEVVVCGFHGFDRPCNERPIFLGYLWGLDQNGEQVYIEFTLYRNSAYAISGWVKETTAPDGRFLGSHACVGIQIKPSIVERLFQVSEYR